MFFLLGHYILIRQRGEYTMLSGIKLIPLDPLTIGLIIAWSLLWKALALWHAARNNQLAWYIWLVIINTAGILEIIYLIFFRKRKFLW